MVPLRDAPGRLAGSASLRARPWPLLYEAAVEGRQSQPVSRPRTRDDDQRGDPREAAVTGTVMNRLDEAWEELARRAPPVVRLALKVLLVAVICHLSIQIGHASKLPPHNISALWPASAVLVSILVASPARHWWAYLLGGYATYAFDVARAGFLVSDALYQVADITQVLIAAVGVRWFADGLRAFESLRTLARYITFAVLLAPAISAFVAAFAGGTQNYWFYWRAWFFSEALAFLSLAPGLLTWIRVFPTSTGTVPPLRFLQADQLAWGLP